MVQLLGKRGEIPMPEGYLKKLQEPGQRVNPLFQFLGVKVERLTAEQVVLALPFREDFLQGGGVIAGGVMATLADEAMAHLILANLGKGQSTATIEMNFRFLRPLKQGEIFAEAALVKKGRQVFTVESRVRDAEGRLLAQGGASFMVVDVKPGSANRG
jgi:uncharacterized protein (TIGR00369 family)